MVPLLQEPASARAHSLGAALQHSHGMDRPLSGRASDARCGGQLRDRVAPPHLGRAQPRPDQQEGAEPSSLDCRWELCFILNQWGLIGGHSSRWSSRHESRNCQRKKLRRETIPWPGSLRLACLSHSETVGDAARGRLIDLIHRTPTRRPPVPQPAAPRAAQTPSGMKLAERQNKVAAWCCVPRASAAPQGTRRLALRRGHAGPGTE